MTRPPCPYDIIEINPKNPVHMIALKKAYEEVYLARFTDPKVIEPYELWVDHISQSLSEDQQHIVLVGGNHLDDPKKMTVAGISVAVYYTQAGSGLLAYNATSPNITNDTTTRKENRPIGLGKMMVHRRINLLIERHKLMNDQRMKMGGDYTKNMSRDIRMIAAEIKNPSLKHVSNDGLDPDEREAGFLRNGATKLAFNYHASLVLLSYQVRRNLPPTLGDIKMFVEAMRACSMNYIAANATESLERLADFKGYHRFKENDPWSTRIVHGLPAGDVEMALDAQSRTVVSLPQRQLRRA